MTGYDWGITPQQPTAPSTPPQKPQKKGGVPKGALIAGGAVLGVIALGFGGLLAASALHRGPDNPAGVSDEQAASYFSGYSLSTCDFGEEFYAQAGIRDVEVNDNGCLGWTIAQEGQPSVRVWMEESTYPFSSTEPVHSAELPNWRTKRADQIPGETWFQTSGGDANKSCLAFPSTSRMGDWIVSTAGPCEAITPLLTQLENLTRQQAWNETDRGLFDFDEHPGYLEAGSPTFDLYSAWAEKDTVEPGVAIEAPQSDFNGSTIAVNSVVIRDDELCVNATFTLGENSSRYSRTFYLPHFEAYYGTHERTTLYAQSPSGLRLDVGESHSYRACGQAPVTVHNGDMLVDSEGSSVDQSLPSWRFPAEQVKGPESV